MNIRLHGDLAFASEDRRKPYNFCVIVFSAGLRAFVPRHIFISLDNTLQRTCLHPRVRLVAEERGLD